MTALKSNFHARPILYDIRQSPTDFDSFTTSDDNATVYTWITTFMGLKIIHLTAVDNDILYTIMGSYDGINFPKTIASTATLKAGNEIYITNSNFYAAIQISAQSAVTNSPGTLELQCIATSMGANGSSSSGSDSNSNGPSAINFERIELNSTSDTMLSPAVYADATDAMISIEGNQIRVRWDGTAPTTTVGHLLQSGDILQLDNTTDINRFMAISITGSSVLDVTYSK